MRVTARRIVGVAGLIVALAVAAPGYAAGRPATRRGQQAPPARVTVELDDVSLPEALRAVFGQAHARYRIAPGIAVLKARSI